MNPFMIEALQEAKIAAELNEVPVGAVLVKDKQIIFRAHNTTEAEENPLRHAEFSLLSQALSTPTYRRLAGCSLYVTLEPCPMCAGAILLAKPDRVYFGAYDPAVGACGGKYDLLRGSGIEVYGGIMEAECQALLKSFFKTLRK